MRQARHPQADPECEHCQGFGWLIADHDGMPAIQRCDECLYHGTDDPRTVWDEDVIPLAALSGINCRAEYPCLVSTEGPANALD